MEATGPAEPGGAAEGYRPPGGVWWVAEGFVPPSQLTNPFRHTFSGHSWSDYAPAAMCPCGGQYVYSPAQHAHVCGGGRWFRRASDGGYVEWTTRSCGRVEPGHSFGPDEAVARSTSYNPNHHLNTWLLRLQGVEDADVPDYFLRLVCRELWRVGVVPSACTLDDLNDALERITLRRLNCRPMYEHRILIYRRLRPDVETGIRAAECDQIRHYFREFTRVYDELPGDLRCGRSSYIEYSYTIYMICLILGYEHVLPWLPLVRSGNIIDEYNAIFEEVCRRLGWPLANLSRSSLWAAK